MVSILAAISFLAAIAWDRYHQYCTSEYKRAHLPSIKSYCGIFPRHFSDPACVGSVSGWVSCICFQSRRCSGARLWPWAPSSGSWPCSGRLYRCRSSAGASLTLSRWKRAVRWTTRKETGTWCHTPKHTDATFSQTWKYTNYVSFNNPFK